MIESHSIDLAANLAEFQVTRHSAPVATDQDGVHASMRPGKSSSHITALRA
jgi:hypothetical protein